MTLKANTIQVAVIGSGLTGSACAASLQRSGAQVTLFEKAPTVGGRTATRHAGWIDARGAKQSVTFYDNAQYFESASRRCKPAIARAMAANGIRSWHPRVYAVWPFGVGQCIVPPAEISSLCTHLIGGAAVHLNRTVRRLQRAADGSWYVVSDGSPLAGPFHSVVVALPPAQAAVLLAGHQDKWADMVLAKHIAPLWTLIAITDDVDWPWDAAQPERGPLAWVQRNDRLPESKMPFGLAVWTAHATAEWSLAHSEDDPQAVAGELQKALRAQLPKSGRGNQAIQWHYTNAYSERSSKSSDNRVGANEVWWDESLSLGVCGNSLMDGGVAEAWSSGDELAGCMAASFKRSATTDYNNAALVITPRTTLHSPLRNTNLPVATQQATGMLVPPIQGEAGQFADAK